MADLDGLTGRALLEAVGALAELGEGPDKRRLQRSTWRQGSYPERAPGVYTEHWPAMPTARPSQWAKRHRPCTHCKPNEKCLKHM